VGVPPLRGAARQNKKRNPVEAVGPTGFRTDLRSPKKLTQTNFVIAMALPGALSSGG